MFVVFLPLRDCEDLHAECERRHARRPSALALSAPVVVGEEGEKERGTLLWRRRRPGENMMEECFRTI